MNYLKEERLNALSAEYVVGTLRGKARTRYQKLMLQYQAVSDATAQWEQYLTGIASVFGDLNAQSGSLVMNVFAFNIGVELGQLAIVTLLLPLLILLRNVRLYSKAIMPITSSVIAVVAINWTLQRW